MFRENKIFEAIAIFKLNTKEYTTSFIVFDSLGEAYMVKGDDKLAILNYQKLVDLNPENESGIYAFKKLKGK